jgi:hypothetical protein
LSQFPPHHPPSRARRHFLGLAAAASARVATASAVAWSALTSSANAGNPSSNNPGNNGNPSNNNPGNNAPCFLRGTSILTPRGEVRIEELRIGDLVETIHAKALPVKWIGRRSFRTGGPSWPEGVMPIRIRRHAIDTQTPARDLYLSPGHALLIEDVLVPVKDLINGISIAPALPAGTETIEYFNILLDTHEGILAEGVPVETGFMTGRDYENFSNFGEYARLYGEEMPPMTRFAPMFTMSGREHLKALLRLGGSRFFAMSNPVHDAYDRIVRRATELV